MWEATYSLIDAGAVSHGAAASASVVVAALSSCIVTLY